MKKLLVLVLCICSINVIAQWEIQSQVPDSISLRDVFFINNNCGWAVGDDEIILKTCDAGVTWIVQNEYSGYCGDNWLNDVFFLDENIGWAVGDRVINTGGSWGTIFHTTNGGDLWSLQLQSGLYKSMNGVYFTDNVNGWAVCGTYGLIKSIDSGENWDHLSPYYANLNCVFFVNELYGWAGGYEAIMNTQDGGNNWNIQLANVEDTRFYDIYFTDTLHGWAVGELQSDESGVIYSTVNSGETWNLIAESTQILWSCFFIDNYCGWIVGGFETVLYTTDGGENWHDQSVEGSGWLHNIFITEDYQGWIAGGHLYHTDLSMIIGIEAIDVEESFYNITIFPNPSSTQITIELPTTPQKNTSLTIYNLNGQLLIKQPITEPQTVVDINGLPSGVYFVKVVDDGTVMMGKVVKE